MELSWGRHASFQLKWGDTQAGRAAPRLLATLPAMPARRPGPGDHEDGAILSQHGSSGRQLGVGAWPAAFSERRGSFAESPASDLRHDVRSGSVASHASAAQLVWEGGAEGAPFPAAPPHDVLNQLNLSVKRANGPPKTKRGAQTQQELSSWEWACISEGNPCVILEDSAEQTNLEDVFMNADAQTHRLGVIEPPSADPRQTDFNAVLDSAQGSLAQEQSQHHDGAATAQIRLHADVQRQVRRADELRTGAGEPSAARSSDGRVGPARETSREPSGASPYEAGGVATSSSSSKERGDLPLYRRVGKPEGLEPEFESDSELSDDNRCGNCGKPLLLRPVKKAAKQRPIPTIFPLTSAALRALIPVSGSGTQVLESLGGPADWLRRFVASMGGAVLMYNLNPILTIVAAFYWAWGPLWAAALSNMALRARYPYAGLWVARLRKLQVQTGPGGEVKWRLLIGDRAGVAVELVADPPSLPIRLRPGEPVQMVAVSDTPSFSRFRVLREAFLPRRGIWLAQQNIVERPVFESLQVHLVPAVLNKMPSQDEEDWDSQYSLMCDETNETVRQYNYDQDGMEIGPELPFGVLDADGMAPAYGSCDCGSDLGLSAMFADPLDAELRDQYREG